MDTIHLTPEDRLKLIEDAKDGNSYALSQLLQECYPAVFRFLVKLTLDTQLAADLTQDCMIRVVDRLSLYEPAKAALSTWMIAIAKNLWLDECRSRKRHARYLENEDALAAAVSFDDIDRLLERDELFHALKRLKEKFRIPLLLKYAQGYTCEEIAKMLHIPGGTVKSRLFKGAALLREELKDHEK